ncbi:M48 family metallopeptidase [Paenarthrobacter aurescens]|uniref:Metal-dependent hydrolase n=1 Tax=Paenarthrobacter aurescens TaxID=43663 RepID=A0A4Y3NNT9_PAEAU|nr:M48 family metallopeptidase [Paenarthrobacter aurescens]MDO6144153.1 M48 family metallopeptidase [Paenarthrobacter aurescens]MDO6148000.1 M48 family metallopeptidase [Paenarthrobacter aurescens]MDO6159244.1 M48 family metallopeptidase [Paenarthrobacter aurescens]MDO6163227.1 M48 family metallopeptidase [Paenarthrobacter aurescens]GEB20708.1 metal-dependent hydrolase [Paenarthrobacter aurescens]
MSRQSASDAGVPHVTDDGAPVVVRRSARRRRTVAAFWEDGSAVIAIPASFTKSQEREWVRKMLAKLKKQGERQTGSGRRRPATDQALAKHAEYLSQTYLGGRAVPSSVRWVSNQNSRWGSATPADGTIRLSNKLQRMPQWVIDYVLVHELAHLLVAGHNAAFWKLVEAYPETQRAKAFLEGVAFATSRGIPAEADTEDTGNTAGAIAD